MKDLKNPQNAPETRHTVNTSTVAAVLRDKTFLSALQQLGYAFNLECSLLPAQAVHIKQPALSQALSCQKLYESSPTISLNSGSDNKHLSIIPLIINQQLVAEINAVHTSRPSCSCENTAFSALINGFQLAIHQQFELRLDQLQTRQETQRWKYALHNSFGVWDWQIGSDHIVCSEQCFDLLGLPQQPNKQLRDLFRKTHPQDRYTFKSALRTLLEGHSDMLDCETRFQHHDGHYVWLRNRGKITDWDTNGSVLRVVGTSVNIQNRKTDQEQVKDLCRQLQASEQRYRQLMQHSSDPIILADMTTERIIDANHQMQNLSGYSLKELFELNYKDLFSPEQADSKLSLEQYDPKSGPHYDMILRQKSGQKIAVDIGCAAIEVSGYKLLQCNIHDISEHKEIQQQLQHLAHHDPLTGLPNRILFLDRLQQAIVKAKRNNTLVALCFIDLDNFKQINDKMGHNVGDLVLIEIAKQLKEGVRASDTTARLGGDEFVIILEDIENQLAIQQIISKILAQIGQPIAYQGNQIKVTSSIGVSIYPTTTRDLDQLVCQADRAMYRAKESGNCLRFFSDIKK